MGLQPVIRAAYEYDVIRKRSAVVLISGVEKKKERFYYGNKENARDLKTLHINYTFNKTAVKNKVLCVSRLDVIFTGIQMVKVKLYDL